MVLLKIFFIAFIAFFALVNSEADAQRHEIITDDFEDYYEYQQILLLLNASSNEYLHSLEKAVQAEVEILTHDLNQAFMEAQELFERVAEIQEEAELLGNNYKACFNEHYPKMHKLIKETKVAQTACSEAIKEEVSAIEESFKQQLAEVIKDLAAVFEEVKKCKGIECLQETDVEIFETVEDARSLVRAAIHEVENVVEEWSPEAVDCVVAASDDFREEMKMVFTNM